MAKRKKFGGEPSAKRHWPKVFIPKQSASDDRFTELHTDATNHANAVLARYFTAKLEPPCQDLFDFVADVIHRGGQLRRDNWPSWLHDFEAEIGEAETKQVYEAVLYIVCTQILEQARSAKDATAVSKHAYRLGVLAEQIRTREAKRRATAKRRAKAQAKSPLFGKHRTRRMLWEKWQAKVDLLRGYKPNAKWTPKLSHDRACHLAASQLGESYNTLKDRVENRTPRNKIAKVR